MSSLPNIQLQTSCADANASSQLTVDLHNTKRRRPHLGGMGQQKKNIMSRFPQISRLRGDMKSRFYIILKRNTGTQDVVGLVWVDPLG
jgi:hypothetical protein